MRNSPDKMGLGPSMGDLATRPPYRVRDRLGVHRRTVDNFRIALFEKFNIKSKTGLVLFALRYGLMKV